MHIHLKQLFWTCIILCGTLVNSSISFSEEKGNCLCDKLENPAHLAEFFDQQLAVGLKQYNTAGAAVVVVKDGKTIFSKGYGRADVENDTVVSPEDTLFRMASVSKIFTVTAVMQLVEQGKLNLDVDVNRYLKNFQIPDTFDNPITLRHLITHTAGFEDKWAGVLFLSDPSRLVPLSQSLKELMPARIWPVGQYAAYSNFGISLAGLIVENVSGTPFDQYIEENIFSPLGMSKSSFQEPLPAQLLATPPMGYIYDGQNYLAQDFEYVHNLAPAGAMTSTASDMANFMIVHLQEGQFGPTRILGQEAAQQMQTQDFSHHKDLNGMAFGFHVGMNNGVETIYHDGDTNHFHTMMTLQKASKTGLFIAVNSAEGDGIIGDLTKAFYEEFYTPTPHNNSASTSQPFDAEQYAGAYRMNRHNYHGFEKLLGLIFEVSVDNSPDHGLRILGGNSPSKLIKGTGDLFHVEGKDKKLAFGRGDDGRVNYLFLGDRPNSAFYKLAWYETRNSHLLLWGGAILISLTMVFRLRKPILLARREDKFNFFASLASLFILLFFAVLVYMLIIQQDLLYDYIPSTFYIAMTFGVLIVPATIGSFVYLGFNWRDATHLGRLYRLSLCAVFVTLLLSMNYWCLLGYHP